MPGRTENLAGFQPQRLDFGTPALPYRPAAFTETGCWLVFPIFCSLHFSSTSLLIVSSLWSSYSSALAASGGQLPISSLEEAGHMLLSGPGGATVPTALRPSLFLNHPAFLPIVTGSMATVSSPAMGLFSGSNSSAPRPTFSQSSSPGASNLMSPTSCPEETPCSSPASFCSFSEAPSPPLGGTMAD